MHTNHTGRREGTRHPAYCGSMLRTENKTAWVAGLAALVLALILVSGCIMNAFASSADEVPAEPAAQAVSEGVEAPVGAIAELEASAYTEPEAQYLAEEPVEQVAEPEAVVEPEAAVESEAVTEPETVEPAAVTEPETVEPADTAAESEPEVSGEPAAEPESVEPAEAVTDSVDGAEAPAEPAAESEAVETTDTEAVSESTTADAEGELSTEAEAAADSDSAFFDTLMAAESCEAMFNLMNDNADSCYGLTADQLAQLEQKLADMPDDGYLVDVSGILVCLGELLEPTQEGDGTSVSPYAATYGAGETFYTNELSPTYSKYVKDNGDGTYDLTLDVTGATGSEENPALVDILFVVDVSGSMTGTMGSTTRLKAVQTAISNLVTSLNNNSEIDALYDLLSFSSTANTPTGWVNGTALTAELDNLSAEGGTNYQDALVQAGSEIQSARSGAVKIVFFLTDGLPQHCLATVSTESDYDFSLSTTTGGRPEGGPGGGQPTTTTTYYKLSNSGSDVSFVGYYGSDGQKYGSWFGSIMGANAVTCDYFYAVGFGDEMGTTPSGSGNVLIYEDHTPLELLQAVAEGTTAGTREAVVTDDLSTYFSNITSTITNITVSNVTITDTLSEYAQATADSKLVIMATNGSGEIQTANGTISEGASLTIDGNIITASYDTENKLVVLNFPDNYTLGDHWTYSVTLTIEPTDVAYAYYAQNGYLHTGDSGTDAPDNTTSSGQYGFHCNESATLFYKVITGETADSGHTQYYDHPVIQVKTTTVTITKQVTGNMGDTSKEFPFTVTCDSAMGVATDNAYTLSDDGKTATFTLSDDKYVTLNGVKKGSTLTITESSADGYAMTVQVGSQELVAYSNGTYSYTVPTNGSDPVNITVINDKDVTIDTGVWLDAVPYILILAVVAAGAAFLVVRRNHGEK